MYVIPKLITAPIKEPISVAEAKAQSRISTSSEDSLIAGYISAARVYYEERTARTIHDTTWEIALPSFYGTNIFLPRATPLIEVVSVIYTDSDGVETVVDDGEYIESSTSEDIYARVGRISLGYNKSWPSFTAYPVAPVKIRYRAGLAASPEVEAEEVIKHAIKLLVSGMYENRESELLTNRDGMQFVSQKYGAEAFIQMRQVEWPC